MNLSKCDILGGEEEKAREGPRYLLTWPDGEYDGVAVYLIVNTNLLKNTLVSAHIL